jgi:hypothetical protein
MPSTSKKQADFMRAVAHSPKFAKKVGVPQSVGKDFSTADKSRKFKEGGDTMATTKMGKPTMKRGMDKAKDGMKKPTPFAKGKMPAFAKGGAIDGCATKGKTKGKMITMASGGKAC